MSSKCRAVWIMILWLTTALPLLAQGMRLLRPVPQRAADTDRAQLSAQHSRLLEDGSALCYHYAVYKARCESPDSTKAAPADCPEALSQISRSLADYNQRADNYNDAVVSSLRREVENLGTKVKNDQQAIRNLGLHHSAAEFDAWSVWLTAADNERQKQVEEAFKAAAKDAAMSKIEAAFRLGVNRAAALDPRTAQQIIVKLQAAGVGDPYFLQAIQKFAAVKNKQEKAEAALALLERLKMAKAVWDLHDLRPDQESGTWEAGSILLELFIPDPELELVGKLTLNEVRATFYNVNEVIDFGVFETQINNLEKLTDQQSSDLKLLSQRLEADVQAKKQASDERAVIDRQPAEGGCEQEPVAWELQTPHRHSKLSLSLSENVWNDKPAYEIFWGNLLLTSNTLL